MGLDCIYQQQEEGGLTGAAGKGMTGADAETAVIREQQEAERTP